MIDTNNTTFKATQTNIKFEFFFIESKNDVKCKNILHHINMISINNQNYLLNESLKKSIKSSNQKQIIYLQNY